MMKKIALLFIALLCLPSLAGCPMEKPQPRMQMVEIHPEHLKLALVVGQTTRRQVADIIGSPHSHHVDPIYGTNKWWYNWLGLAPQNVVLDISATGSDGFTYTYRWDFRTRGVGSHSISLTFSGDVLIGFQLH